MKFCIVQPYYSFNSADIDKCYREMMALVDKCDSTMDVIVLPEYCDIPANTDNAEQFNESIEKYNDAVYKKAVETARRCNAIVFANFGFKTELGWRNTTYAFDREGNEVGKYFKAHPAPSEVKTAEYGGNGMDCSYSYEYEKPYTVDIEGVRYGFMTCYDFYMYEGFASLARQNVDVIIGCSHQRTDTHNALDVIGRFLSYNTNAYLVRSSVSLGEDSKICGCSMIVSPKGEILVDMKSEVGLATCEFDPHEKYYKPAGFKGKPKSHYEYIDEGRRPWLYRNGGSMMIPNDTFLPYPRICAHRGFHALAPENSLPAFGAAVALGADEIEFDIWSTKDGELVSIHDSVLDRVSDGKGYVGDYTYEELLKFDFGSKYSPALKGLHIVKFEEILKKFACTTIMNIHVKIWDEDVYKKGNAPDPQYEKIAGLLHQYDCEHHCYTMTVSDKCHREFHEIAPDIHRCVGWDGNKDPLSMPKRAIAIGAEKIQLFRPYFNQETVDLAKKHGIICNVFWTDKPEEVREYLDMGIDTILSNNFFLDYEELKKDAKKQIMPNSYK